jgi:hypothetical protein
MRQKANSTTVKTARKNSARKGPPMTADGLEHLANDLNVALEGARSKEFRAEPYYDRDTDSLVFYERDVRSYAKRINKYLTIYLSCADDTVVGFKIKGVQRPLLAAKGLRDFPLYTTGQKGGLFVPERMSKKDYELLKTQISNSLAVILATAVEDEQDAGLVQQMTALTPPADAEKGERA